MAKDKNRERQIGERLEVGDVVSISAWSGEMKITIAETDDTTASKGGFIFPREYGTEFKAINPKIDGAKYTVWERLP